MATPNWHAVATGTAMSAGDITQFQGTHNIVLLYQGVSQVSYLASSTGYTNTNTGSAAQWIAQPFTTAASQTTITRIDLYVTNTGGGFDTTIEIRSNNAGAPSNTVLASCPFPADFQITPGTSYTSIPFNVTGLTASTQYHIVIDGTSSTSAYLRVSHAATSVNACQVSASGSGGWSGGGFTLDFNVFSGINGMLRNTLEDYTALTNGGISGSSAPGRWTSICYTSGSTTPFALLEQVGSLRSFRTLTYVNGQLTSVT